MPVDDISQLLRAWSDGDQLALRDLTPVVYAELRRLAHRYMRSERNNHSLQTSALVNEAYIRLVVDTLNGFVVRRRVKLGVPTPVNQALLALVKLREAQFEYAGTSRS